MLLRLYICTIIISVFPLSLIAQDKQQRAVESLIDSSRNHIIVLIDRSGSMKKSGNINIVRELITREIPKLLFEEGIVINEKTLLQKDDYLSIAFFGLGGNNRYDYKNYINQELVVGDKRPIGKTYSRVTSRIVFDSLWQKIEENYNQFFSGNFTGLSFAGPTGFHYFKNKEKTVHQTFVLIVSDGQYHSIDDPTSELRLKSIIGKTGINHRFKNNGHIEEVFSDVKSNYSWHPELLSRAYGQFSLNLYEYVPNQLNLDIRSKLKFPTEVELDRTPDGYEGMFKITDIDPRDIYVPQKVLTRILSKDMTDTISQDIDFFNKGEVSFKIRDIPANYIGEPLNINLAFWVDYNEEAYGAHQLHPFGRKEQGADGLVESVEVFFEKKSRILAFIPLTNRLYKISAKFAGTRQNRNVLFWNVFLISLLFLGFIVYSWWYIIKKRRVTDAQSISIMTVSGIKITE